MMPRAAALILVYGLLPLWAAIVYLLVGVARWSSDFLLAAPFAIVLAVRPTGVTLAIALATLAVYRLTPGDPVRKHRFASVTITTLSLIALSWAGIQWQRHQQRETERATERENDMLLAAEFVKSNDVVLREVGGGITRFSIRTWTQDSTGRLLRHEAMLHGKGDVMYAIVEVQRDSAGRPTFFLACTTTIDSGQRDPFKHPCEQTR